VDGVFRKGEAIRAMATRTEADIDEIGFFSPQMMPTDQLAAGEVGYLITGLKDVTLLRVGDTLTTRARSGAQASAAGRPGGGQATEPLPGYREVKPMVFCGLFPIDSDDYPDLRDALEKLTLNDAALAWEPETSDALGFGFRCGFLGLLHMEIVQERLEREFDIDLITTAPSVRYRITTTGAGTIEVDNPTKFPSPSAISKIEEPVITAMIITSEESVGAILQLCEDKRGVQKNFEYLSPTRVLLTYDLPLNEIVLDFYDRLKSVSRGYASLDYHLSGYKEADLVKLDVLVGGEPVDALTLVCHREFAYERGKELVTRLRKLIPRQMFEVPIQAAIGSRVIARETVAAMRKNVLAKCYGGDITRKRKLLEKQKEGKKRMKRVGRVDIPQEAFLAVLKVASSSENE